MTEFINVINAMKKIIFYHIYNVFKFSYVGDYEEAFEKSKETFSSHFTNLLIILIGYPLWILFDFNSAIKTYIGTDRYEIKHFFIIIILLIVLLSYTKINLFGIWLNKWYTKGIVDKSIEIYENSPKFLNFIYRFFFVLLNPFWILIMFFVWLGIFQFLGSLF